MTEMLISSPSSTGRCKGWGTGSTDFKQKLGGGGGKEEQNIKIPKIILLFQHFLEHGFPLLFICSASPIL